MTDQDRIVDAVCNALDGLRAPMVGTKAVKTALCRAGRKAFEGSGEEAWVFASGVKNRSLAHGGEWLFDVTCLLYDDEGCIRRVPFVAESEWGNRDDVRDDFEKLILARAEVRIMVFDRGHWPSTDAAMAEIMSWARTFESAAR